MLKFIGIDGGGTKTDMVMFTSQGKVIARVFSGGSNSQIVGQKRAVAAITDGLGLLLQKAETGLSDVSYIFAGLAGADLPSDHEMLDRIIRPLFGDRPSTICNDTWIALSAGTGSPWGAVSICGTGHNLAHKTQDGRQCAVRGLSYELGNTGGAIDLACEALHHAFRGEEKTGPETLLTTELPAFTGAASLDEILHEIYAQNRPVDQYAYIAKLVFKLAAEGDEVCINLLSHMGNTLGDMLGRFIVHNEPDADSIPVVLAGSLYQKAECSYLSDAMKAALLKYVPHAKTIISTAPPVTGACIEALRTHYTPDEKIRMQLEKEIQSAPVSTV